MREVPIIKIIERAELLSKENKKWHFHMLGKNCCFNKNKEKFCIVFEEQGSDETLFSLFDEKPLKESKELANLMYGAGFLENQEEGEHNPDFEPMLKKAEELVQSGKDWHHHHLHPACVFNEHKGKHCIVLEDETSGGKQTMVYNQKPMADLVKIEKLFYKELD